MNIISKNKQIFYSQLEQMFADRELENFKGKIYAQNTQNGAKFTIELPLV